MHRSGGLPAELTHRGPRTGGVKFMRALFDLLPWRRLCLIFKRLNQNINLQTKLQNTAQQERERKMELSNNRCICCWVTLITLDATSNVIYE